jgi:hypothetical protein
VAETESSVTIMGIVPSYHLKQSARETVWPALKGRQLVDQIDVHAEKTEITPELRQWAQQQFTDEEILAGLQEVRDKGGVEFSQIVEDLKSAGLFSEPSR